MGALATPGGNKGLDFLKGKMSVNVRKIEKETESTNQPVAKPVIQNPVSGPCLYKVTVDDHSYEVLVEEGGEVAAIKPVSASKGEAEQKPTVEVRVKLPGNVYEIFVSEGDRVIKGETILVLEAMKMETPVTAPADGVIATVNVEKGTTVKTGQVIATLQ